jgi:hypothetical protein
LQEVLLEIVENLDPFHYVDASDGNDFPINGFYQMVVMMFLLFARIFLMVH